MRAAGGGQSVSAELYWGVDADESGYAGAEEVEVGGGGGELEVDGSLYDIGG